MLPCACHGDTLEANRSYCLLSRTDDQQVRPLALLMNAPFADYLLKRIDRPWAWIKVFGFCLMAALATVGYAQNGVRAALDGAIVGLFAGVLLGLLFGGIAWLGCRVLGDLVDRPVRRPDLWALHLRCTRCEYRTTPEGPWRVRDCMSWPEECPSCGGELVLVKPTCPRCGAGGLSGKSVVRDCLSQIRWPRNLRQAIWGGYTCNRCNCLYDKWGREVLN